MSNNYENSRALQVGTSGNKTCRYPLGSSGRTALRTEKCDLFEVTSRKHVSTAVAGDFCYKVCIVEARSRGNAQTLLLEAVFPTRSA
jgi:hypothetical protein